MPYLNTAHTSRPRRLDSGRRGARVVPIFCIALAAVATSSRALGLTASPASLAPSLFVPAGAQYLTADGAVRIVGYNDMRAIIERWDRLFVARHPGIRFELLLKGTATAAPALAFGISAFAPMGAEFSKLEMENYRELTGGTPLAVRVGHATARPGARSGPVHIFVHPTNPIERITTAQIAQIFCAGCPEGAVARWGQLGLSGDWADRAVHPVTIGDEAPSGGGPFLEQRLLNGRPFVLDGNRHAGSADNVRRVAEDRLAIGLATDNVMDASVKVIAVTDSAGPGALPSDDSIRAGAYPLGRDLLIYIRPERTDPLVIEYLRLVLSKEGQEVVATSPPFYLPLTVAEAATELSKLRLVHHSATAAAFARSGGATVVASYRWCSLLRAFAAELDNGDRGVRFEMHLMPTSVAALQALSVGASAFAPLERDAWPTETRPFRQLHGYEPTAIRVGRLIAIAGRSAPGFYVSATNPLRAVSLEQIGRAFTLGAPGSDLAYWSQLGLDGDWMWHAIHLYGPRDDGQAFTALRFSIMGGRPLNARYESLPDDDAIAIALAGDRYGLAYLDRPPTGAPLRRVALMASRPLRNGSSAELAAADPIAPALNIYVDKDPERGIAPAVKRYIRFVLSPRGQAIIATHSLTTGFVPLLPSEIGAELAKLESSR